MRLVTDLDPPTNRQLNIICISVLGLLAIFIVISLITGIPKVLTMSLSAIILAGSGTVLTLLPSLLKKLHVSEEVESLEEYRRHMDNAVKRLSEGETITSGDPEYRILVGYLIKEDEITEGDLPEEIKFADTSPEILKLDDETLWESKIHLMAELVRLAKMIEDAEDRTADRRERQFVIRGVILYGMAIILQSAESLVDYFYMA